MKKIYCVICDKYKKFYNYEISYIFEKHQFFVSFSVSLRMKMKNYIKRKNQWRYSKTIELKIYNYFKNIVEENISKGFGLKNINKAKKLFP